MIDWNAPLETTPDARNPEPVSCEVVVNSRNGSVKDVRINGDWFCDRGNRGNAAWLYEKHRDGASNDWLPVLRNVQP